MEYKTRRSNYLTPILYTTLCAGTMMGSCTVMCNYATANDGSDERGFVEPPKDRKLPPAPPRSVSSAETMLASCCCPVTPMSRTEAKKPPKPPVALTKIQH